MPRTILAFNGDLESRLALHWLVHERGYEVITLSINLGQEIYLEPLGELALELGATAAQVLDRREMFLRDFALPVLQADAVYQTSCFLGSALARYVIAQELVRAGPRGRLRHGRPQRRQQGQRPGPHGDRHRRPGSEAQGAGPGARMEPEEPGGQAQLRPQRSIPIEEPTNERVKRRSQPVGRQPVRHDLTDAWQEPPADAYVLTKSARGSARLSRRILTIGFEAGVPCSLNGTDAGRCCRWCAS